MCVCVYADTYAIFYSIHDRIAVTQSWILPVKCFVCLLVCYKIFTYVEIFLLPICSLYNYRILYWDILYWDICVTNGQHNLTSAISYVASWEVKTSLFSLSLDYCCLCFLSAYELWEVALSEMDAACHAALTDFNSRPLGYVAQLNVRECQLTMRRDSFQQKIKFGCTRQWKTWNLFSCLHANLSFE